MSKPTVTANDAVASGILAKSKALADLHGGLVIYSFKVVRVLGCVTLFGISVVGPLMHRGGSKDLKWDDIFNVQTYPDIALALTFVSRLSSLDSSLF